MTHSNIASRRLIAVTVIALLVVITGISVTLAQQLVQPDGRLNQVAHFGGDALYCKDANDQTTNRLPALLEGSFSLLSKNGQELWTVSGADVDAALAAAKESGQSQLIASGQGSYGVVALYGYYMGNNATFFFTGYDEHGKPNSLTFTGCTPVGPARQPEAAASTPDVEMCLAETEDESASGVIECARCELEGGILDGGVCYFPFTPVP